MFYQYKWGAIGIPFGKKSPKMIEMWAKAQAGGCRVATWAHLRGLGGTDGDRQDLTEEKGHLPEPTVTGKVAQCHRRS